MRTKYKKLPHDESEARNKQMYQVYLELVAKEVPKMTIYQLLADQNDIEERNSVASIINKIKKSEAKKNNSKLK